MKTATEIQRLTGITAERYAQAVWDGALAYCKWYGFGKDRIVDSLMLTRSFWRWWRMVWVSMDEQFIREFGQYAHLKEHEYMRIMWLNAHRPDKIVSRPNAEIVIEADRIMRTTA